MKISSVPFLRRARKAVFRRHYAGGRNIFIGALSGSLSMRELSELIQKSSKTVGLRQTLKAVESKAARCVIVASDADESVRKRVADAAYAVSCEVKEFRSMEELGRLSGIDVPCAVVGILS